MHLDYIGNINEYGDSVVRLYNFNKSEAIKFRDDLSAFIASDEKQFQLENLDYIISRNCKLTLRIAREDDGIESEDNVNFYCYLTLDAYRKMLVLLAPFCLKESKGHQYLYDVDNLTDFLFSPAGTW